MDDPTTEWSSLFLTLSDSIMWDQCRALNWAGYTTTDQILFGEVTTCGLMKFLLGLWKAWIAIHRHLLLDPVGTLILAHQRVTDIVKFLHPFSALNEGTTISLLAIMSKLGIMWAQDFWDNSTHAVKDFEEKFRRIQGLTPELDTTTHQLITTTQGVDGICGKLVPDLDKWIWTSGDPMAGTFSLLNKTTYLLLLRPQMPRKWLMTDGSGWKILWRFDLTRRAKIILWRITMQGLYPREHAHWAIEMGCAQFAQVSQKHLSTFSFHASKHKGDGREMLYTMKLTPMQAS